MESAEFLKRKAIKAATAKDWPEAIETNLSLLKLQPEDIATLNRLAWAYGEIGNIKSARSTYKKVLAIDKYNPIALKNLKRLASLNQKQAIDNASIREVSSLFLEDPGKTKVISLARLAPPKVLAGIGCAEPVKLVIKKRRISIRDRNNRYLGVLPDDLSFRLFKLIKGGSQYQGWIKGVEKDDLQIFIREIKKSPRFENFPSFPQPREKKHNRSISH